MHTQVGKYCLVPTQETSPESPGYLAKQQPPGAQKKKTTEECNTDEDASAHPSVHLFVRLHT